MGKVKVETQMNEKEEIDILLLPIYEANIEEEDDENKNINNYVTIKIKGRPRSFVMHAIERQRF